MSITERIAMLLAKLEAKDRMSPLSVTNAGYIRIKEWLESLSSGGVTEGPPGPQGPPGTWPTDQPRLEMNYTGMNPSELWNLHTDPWLILDNTNPLGIKTITSIYIRRGPGMGYTGNRNLVLVNEDHEICATLSILGDVTSELLGSDQEGFINVTPFIIEKSSTGATRNQRTYLMPNPDTAGDGPMDSSGTDSQLEIIVTYSYTPFPIPS